jgi:hypothetical protein
MGLLKRRTGGKKKATRSRRDAVRSLVSTGVSHLNRAEVATMRGQSAAPHLRQAAEAWEVGADAAEEKGAHRQARVLRRLASAARAGSVRRVQNLYHKHERELLTSAAPSRQTFETTVRMGPRGEDIPARVSYHPKMAIMKEGKLQGRGGWSVAILGKSRTGFLPGQSGRTAEEAIRNTEAFARRIASSRGDGGSGTRDANRAGRDPKRRSSKRGAWIGSFGYFWSPMRQRWFVLYSPKRHIETASVVGSYETKAEAVKVAEGK